MTDHDELRRLAQAATEIPNGCCHADAETHHSHFLHSYMDGSAVRLPWAAFIAAANPATVIALLDERDELRDRLDVADKALRSNVADSLQVVADLAAATAEVRRLTEGLDLAAGFIRDVADSTKNGSDLAYMHIPTARRLLAALTGPAAPHTTDPAGEA